MTHWAQESTLRVAVEITLAQICRVANFTSGSHLYLNTALAVHKEHYFLLGGRWVPVSETQRLWPRLAELLMPQYRCLLLLPLWMPPTPEGHLPDCPTSVSATLGPHVLFCFFKDGAPNWPSITDEPWQC